MDVTPTVASPGRQNYNYTYSGPDELAPLQVYEDGKSTYIKYRMGNQPLPSVFVVSPGGAEAQASYVVKDDYLIVDAVAGEMTLKGASGAVHIFNENINP